MKLENQQLIKEYYEEVQKEYPELSFEQVKEIVSAPFSFVKEQMQSPELPTIRLKYFGTFLVYEGRARYILERTERSFQEGKITEKLYLQRKEMLTNFLNNREETKEETE